MTTHIRIVGLLHLALNAVQVVGAVAAITFYFFGTAVFGAAVPESGGVIAFLVGGGLVLGALALLPSLPGFLGGLGLLGVRPWARWVVVIISVIYLFLPPFHTLIGIYSLWALLNQEAEFAFRARGLPPSRL